jgi:S-(hydroxymethyl)glutathione dehydrogenase/alcohol dehydrogenase
VGVGRADDPITFSAMELFFNEKRLLGTIYGSADVRVEFHRLLRLWKAGRLNLEGMISRRVTLDKVNEAFDDMLNGRVIRTVVTVAG